MSTVTICTSSSFRITECMSAVVWNFSTCTGIQGFSIPASFPNLNQLLGAALCRLPFFGRGCRPGQMNYVISRICNELFDSNPSYARINGIVGVLECAKAEFYRRKAVPYEENKIKENGDLP